MHTFAVHSAKPEPSKSPRPTPTLTCPPAAASTSSASAAALADDLQQLRLGGLAKASDGWTRLLGDWRSHYTSAWLAQYCSIDPLRAALDKQIQNSIRSLQQLETTVGRTSGPSSSDIAAIDAELNSLIADLNALKTKVDSETTLAALQADLATLNGQGALYRDATLWVRLVVGAEKVVASGPGLVTLENTLAAAIAAAPAGPEVTDAQTCLNDMKLAVTAGEGLAGPLPATLLAITPSQLSSGAADPTLMQVNQTLFRAIWDLQLGRTAAAQAKHELDEATATPKPTATVTPI
jgi:hypothetical protein